MLNNPVMVEWEDICEPPISWTSLEKSVSAKPMPCRSVGFLVYRDNKKIIIAKDIRTAITTDCVCFLPDAF